MPNKTHKTQGPSATPAKGGGRKPNRPSGKGADRGAVGTATKPVATGVDTSKDQTPKGAVAPAAVETKSTPRPANGESGTWAQTVAAVKVPVVATTGAGAGTTAASAAVTKDASPVVPPKAASAAAGAVERLKLIPKHDIRYCQGEDRYYPPASGTLPRGFRSAHVFTNTRGDSRTKDTEYVEKVKAPAFLAPSKPPPTEPKTTASVGTATTDIYQVEFSRVILARSIKLTASFMGGAVSTKTEASTATVRDGGNAADLDDLVRACEEMDVGSFEKFHLGRPITPAQAEAFAEDDSKSFAALVEEYRAAGAYDRSVLRAKAVADCDETLPANHAVHDSTLSTDEWRKISRISLWAWTKRAFMMGVTTILAVVSMVYGVLHKTQEGFFSMWPPIAAVLARYLNKRHQEMKTSPDPLKSEYHVAASAILRLRPSLSPDEYFSSAVMRFDDEVAREFEARVSSLSKVHPLTDVDVIEKGLASACSALMNKAGKKMEFAHKLAKGKVSFVAQSRYKPRLVRDRTPLVASAILLALSITSIAFLGLTTPLPPTMREVRDVLQFYPLNNVTLVSDLEPERLREMMVLASWHHHEAVNATEYVETTLMFTPDNFITDDYVTGMLSADVRWWYGEAIRAAVARKARIKDLFNGLSYGAFAMGIVSLIMYLLGRKPAERIGSPPGLFAAG